MGWGGASYEKYQEALEPNVPVGAFAAISYLFHNTSDSSINSKAGHRDFRVHSRNRLQDLPASPLVFV